MKKILALVILVSVFGACNNSSTEKKGEVAVNVKQYSIDQFYKNSEIFGGDISDDNKTMLVTTNESGIFNAYEINLGSNKKTALTNSAKESIFANSYVPGTKNIIYNSDKGGNEISHLYLRKSTGEIKDLTPGNQEKANFFWLEP